MRVLVFLSLVLALAACADAPEPTPAAMSTDTLRDSIDAIVAQYDSAEVAVSLRAVVEGETLEFDRQSETVFHAASTMKVPVMIEAFRLVETGRLGWDDPIPVENQFTSIVDGSTFAIEDDSDDALYELRGQTVSVRNLVERAITTSSNLATNLLIELVSADSVQATVDGMGASGMRVLRGVEDIKAFEAGLSNQTTSEALATLMVALRDGQAVSAEADTAMLEILAAQKFNEMIPAGLPEGTRVAHKTGEITRIHHDAAIIYPEGAEPYVLVVLVRGLADTADSARLGAEISRVVYEAVVPQ
ncbi:MAG: serine hydrolase [Bacteroidota bacterium]